MVRTHWKGKAGFSALIAGLAATVAILPSAVRAQPTPGYQAPDGSYCYDLYVDCGYGALETGVYAESFNAYAYSAGTCQTRYAYATRRNLAGFVVFRYNEQVRWCWRGGLLTYFWRDRWPSDTSFSWAFDGHIGSNCTYEQRPRGRVVRRRRLDAGKLPRVHHVVLPSQVPDRGHLGARRRRQRCELVWRVTGPEPSS